MLEASDYARTTKLLAWILVTEDSNIFVISELGYGKRTKVSQFTAHARGGVGIRSAVVNTKTGKLMAVANLTDKCNEVIIISISGPDYKTWP